ncbi:MAG: L,D-transpeptidase [Pseudonocardia sp.]
MRPQSRSARPRTRTVIVAVLILLGVLGSVGVAQAAGGGGGKDGGTVCADGRRDTNPADGVCARDEESKSDKKDGDKKDGDKKDSDKKDGDKVGKKDDGKGDKKDGDKKGKTAAPKDPNLVAGTPCTKAAEACADLKARKAWLIKDGKVTRGPVPLSSGGPGYETPRGDFKVQWKNKDHRSAEFDNAPMPWAVFFTDSGIAFHQGDLKSASHGCIRLGAQDAEAFFNALNTGDDVQVR